MNKIFTGFITGVLAFCSIIGKAEITHPSLLFTPQRVENAKERLKSDV